MGGASLAQYNTNASQPGGGLLPIPAAVAQQALNQPSSSGIPDPPPALYADSNILDDANTM